MTDYAQWLRGQCIYTKMARRSMKKHLERDYCEHCTAADAFESQSAENKRLEALDKDWLRASEQWVAENSRQEKLNDDLFAENVDLAKVEHTLAAENKRLEDAMYRFMRHIQDQIEQEAGWMQFDYYHPEIDAYEYNQFVRALGDPKDHARWSDLLERVSTEQKRTQNGNKDTQDLSVCPECGGYADNGFSRSVPPAPYYCTKCDPDCQQCEDCGDIYSGVFCPCSYEAQDDEPVEKGLNRGNSD